ncbi:MAG: DsbA family protein [Deltaproteobacteria bacterium]|nr:DsbA family protein [Deltaproteobacteria bacterium]
MHGQQNQAADQKKQITALEKQVSALQAKVAVLEDRLDALLGPQPGLKTVELPTGNSPVRGNSDSPLTLVMFGDYQSDATVRASSAVSRLLATYPSQLHLVYKQFPLTQKHPQATEAAVAALAALKQNRFWEMHEQLLANSRRLDPATLLSLAEQVGLDVRRFESDRRSLATLELLDADEKLAAKSGVSGVPALFLNGSALLTWRYDYLKEQVEKALGR